MKGAGVKLSLRELGRPTPETLRTLAGRGDDGISTDGEEDNEGALKGCMNVTLGRLGSGAAAAASFNLDKDV